MKFTSYGREERILDGVMHVLGVSVGIIAVIEMMASAVMLSRPPIAVSFGIYGAGMRAMFGCSAAI